MDIMMFRGVSPTGSAGLGTYIGFGGVLMLLGGIGEWVLGNTFPSVVFTSFGAYWVGLAITLMPYTGAISTSGGSPTPDFYNSFGMSRTDRNRLFFSGLIGFRLLFGVHGRPVLHIRDLRSPHKLDPLPDLDAARAGVRMLDGRLLLHRHGQRRSRKSHHHRRRCSRIRHLHVGLVDLCGHHACGCRLPIHPAR